MKYNEVKKLLGVMAIATTASLTACGTQPTPPIDTAVEAEPTQTVEEPTPTPTPTPTETKITVSYEQSATESDELTKIGDDDVSYIIKDYDADIYYETISEQDYIFQLDEESESIYIGDTLVSENVDFKEDGTLWVRDVVLEHNIPVVKYVRTETEVEARYIGLAPNDSNLVSGITFVMEKNDDGYYKLTGMRGVFDEDITGLAVYEGTFDGWAMESQGEAVYEVDDEIKISGDLTLYPHFTDNANGKVANEDGTCVESQLETIDGQTVLRVIHIKSTKTDKDGNIVETTKYALAGLDAKKDTVKTKDGQTIDKDTVEKQQTEDKLPEDKPASQPAKKSESAQPGQPKPAESSKQESVNNDNTPDYDPELDSGGVDWGALGIQEVADPNACDFSDPYGLHFE